MGLFRPPQPSVTPNSSSLHLKKKIYIYIYIICYFYLPFCFHLPHTLFYYFLNFINTTLSISVSPKDVTYKLLWANTHHYRLKKYSQPKSWELCFIWWEFPGLPSPGGSISCDPERTAQRRWGGELEYREVLQQREDSPKNQKIIVN